MTNAQILYEDNELEVVYQHYGYSRLVITFNELGMIGGRGLGAWGGKAFDKLNISYIGFVSKRPNWFPESSFSAALHVIEQIIDRYHNIITYGHSQGGYGAIRFSKRLKASVVLAFCPQYSISPTIMNKLDNRFTGFFINESEQETLSATHINDDGFVVVFYDEYEKLDKINVSLMSAEISNVHLVSVAHTGHQAVRVIANAERLALLIDIALKRDINTLRALMSGFRRNWHLRAMFLARSLVQKKPDIAINLVLNGWNPQGVEAIREIILGLLESERKEFVYENLALLSKDVDREVNSAFRIDVLRFLDQNACYEELRLWFMAWFWHGDFTENDLNSLLNGAYFSEHKDFFRSQVNALKGGRNIIFPFGWYEQEVWGGWTKNHSAYFVLKKSNDFHQIVCNFRLLDASQQSLCVEFYNEGIWEKVDIFDNQLLFNLEKDSYVIKLVVDRLISPFELGRSSDTRKLGVGVSFVANNKSIDSSAVDEKRMEKDAVINLVCKVFLGKEPHDLEKIGLSEYYKSSNDMEVFFQKVLGSDELYGNILRFHADKLVSSAYLGVLGREADKGGLSAHASVLRSGGELESILNGFVKSEEFLNKKDMEKYFFDIDDMSTYERLLPHIFRQKKSILMARHICKKYKELYAFESEQKYGALQYIFVYRDKKERDTLVAVAEFLQETKQFSDRIYVLSLEEAIFYTLRNWGAKIVFVIAINVLVDILRFIGFFHPIIYMEHGVAPIKRYTYSQHYCNYNYLLLPGRLWVERFRGLYPKSTNRVFDVGYPKLKQETPLPTIKYAYINQFNFNVDSPILLFAPTYSGGNRNAGVFNVKYLSDIKDVNVLVIPHDGDNHYIKELSQQYPTIAFYDGDESISYHYGFVDLVISDISSTAVEFVRLGKKAICINTGHFLDYESKFLADDGIPTIPYTDKKWDFCPVVPPSQLAETVQNIILNEEFYPYGDQFVEDMCSCYGEEACKKALLSFKQIEQELSDGYKDVILTNEKLI